MTISLIFVISNQAVIAGTPTGARIQAGSSGVKARDDAGSATVLGINNAHTYGTVLSGPVDAKISGNSDQTIYHWYQVDWDTPATDGWSADVGFSQPTPNAPTPTAPGYEASPGQVLGASIVSFQWSATSTADAKITTGYQLNIRDVDSNILYNYPTATTSLSKQLVYGHHYRFNVFAYNADLYVSTPDTLYFWIAPRPTIVGPGYSTAPGQLLPNLTPTLSWNALAGALGYKLTSSAEMMGGFRFWELSQRVI